MKVCEVAALHKRFTANVKCSNLLALFKSWMIEYFSNPCVQYDCGQNIYAPLNNNSIIRDSNEYDAITFGRYLINQDGSQYADSMTQIISLFNSSQSCSSMNSCVSKTFTLSLDYLPSVSSMDVNKVYLKLFNDMIGAIRYCYSSLRNMLYRELCLDPDTYSIEFRKIYNIYDQLLIRDYYRGCIGDLESFHMPNYFFKPFVIIPHTHETILKYSNINMDWLEDTSPSFDWRNAMDSFIYNVDQVILPLSLTPNAKKILRWGDGSFYYRTAIMPENNVISYNLVSDKKYKRYLYHVEHIDRTGIIDANSMCITDPKIREHSMPLELVAMKDYIPKIWIFYNLIRGLNVVITDKQTNQIITILDSTNAGDPYFRIVDTGADFECNRNILREVVINEPEESTAYANAQKQYRTLTKERKAKIKSIDQEITKKINDQVLAYCKRFTLFRNCKALCLLINSEYQTKGTYRPTTFNGVFHITITLPFWNVITAFDLTPQFVDFLNGKPATLDFIVDASTPSNIAKKVMVNFHWLDDNKSMQNLPQDQVDALREIHCEPYIEFPNSLYADQLYSGEPIEEFITYIINSGCIDDAYQSFIQEYNQHYCTLDVDYKAKITSLAKTIRCIKANNQAIPNLKLKKVHKYFSLEELFTEVNFYCSSSSTDVKLESVSLRY